VGGQIRPAIRQSDPSSPSAGWRQWHLDEVVLEIAGVKHWLWRAVDQTGIVLDVLVQRRRDTPAAQRMLPSGC
jgi:putative transposase